MAKVKAVKAAKPAARVRISKLAAGTAFRFVSGVDGMNRDKFSEGVVLAVEKDCVQVQARGKKTIFERDLPVWPVAKDGEVTPVVEPTAGEDKEQPERKMFRGQIFGQPVTAVLRWMGKAGIEFDAAKCAVATLGCAGVSDTTVRIQLRAGAKGERGEPATLTRAQVKQIKAACN